ncbi:hypothetical protein MNBD_NITROSPIRAE01-1393 [hydrothermal vent metagenome]|uniref:Uncharacterized protein n=1 Tax=hydrothermal vent metagenome TaxID=652676 RepID=A0A3B1D7W4_9ZZZZ
MELKLIASGIGASIPKINIGFSLFSGVYIQLRDTPTAIPYTFGIASTPEIGGNNGTFIASHVNTKWTRFDIKKHPWLCNKMGLKGKNAEVEIKGTLFLEGKVDISFTIFDENSESKFSISKVGIESWGGQLANTKIRGKIVDMMGKTQHGRVLCAHS